MRAGALAPYEQSLRGRAPLALVATDGRVVDLDLRRWLAPVDDADRSVLARCGDHVLDVGCGPGRFVRALAEEGIAALGVDIAETAVSLTLRQGVPALLRDVFDRVPAEGRWPTVLLMDGNVGIGGDAVRLLRRIRLLLSPVGRLLVEVDPAGVDEVLSVRFSRQGRAVGQPFSWARLGLAALRRYAADAGYEVGETWSADGRVFAELVRSRSTRTA